VRKILRQRLPGETRIAVVENDRLVELHVQRDHEKLALGSVHDAITREKNHGRWRAEIDGENVWLLGHLDNHPGTRLPVRVIRAPIPEPGQIKPAHVVAWRGPADEPPHAWPDAVDIRDFPDTLAVDDYLEKAETGYFPFSHGVISLERTRAGTIIDVDGSADPLDLNLSAATKIAQLLRLYRIGGMVMIDFVGLGNRQQRQTLDIHFQTMLSQDPRSFERTAMNGYGTVQVVRARTGPSVIDQMCGTRRNQASTETQALKLLAVAARSVGAGPRTLTASPLIVAQLKNWPEALRDVMQSLGSPVRLVSDSAVPGYGHVHVTPV
jgi:hypothetical protein